jgi:hypothetical protein
VYTRQQLINHWKTVEETATEQTLTAPQIAGSLLAAHTHIHAALLEAMTLSHLLKGGVIAILREMASGPEGREEKAECARMFERKKRPRESREPTRRRS